MTLAVRVSAATAFVITFFAVAAFAATRSFTAALTGDQQVPMVATTAIGQAKFELNEAGTELSYQINVNGIKDVQGAQLCLAPRGETGPVVAELLTSLIQGEVSGHLTAGTITAAGLRGPLKEKPLSALAAEIEAGRIYVNVFTVDRPKGEIRGQVR